MKDSLIFPTVSFWSSQFTSNLSNAWLLEFFSNSLTTMSSTQWRNSINPGDSGVSQSWSCVRWSNGSVWVSLSDTDRDCIWASAVCSGWVWHPLWNPNESGWLITFIYYVVSYVTCMLTIGLFLDSRLCLLRIWIQTDTFRRGRFPCTQWAPSLSNDRSLELTRLIMYYGQPAFLSSTSQNDGDTHACHWHCCHHVNIPSPVQTDVISSTVNRHPRHQLFHL